MEVWNITQSSFANGDGRCNLWNVKPEHRPDVLPVAFRLCDDDGEVYYCGRATCEHAVLAALDSIGEQAGCTVAMVRNENGHFVPLN